MKPTHPKLGLAFLVILALVFTAVLSPWWFGWIRSTLAQMDQDRRVAASEHVWCYTHMTDTVTGHPPELTRDEIIAYNPYPWITDESIEDDRERTDCFATWQEAWDATDPSLQNTFMPFLPEEPTEEDYAEILPKTGDELLLIMLDTQATREAQIASGEFTREEMAATATAEILEITKRSQEEGAVWCITLLHAPEDKEKDQRAFGTYVGHPPGITIPEFITNWYSQLSPIAAATHYQRSCYSTYGEAAEFVADFDDFAATGFEGLTTEEEFQEELRWNQGGGTGYVLTDPLRYRSAAKAFMDSGEPVSIKFEVDDETMDRIKQQAAEEAKPRDYSGKDIVWCESLLLTPNRKDTWAIVAHNNFDTPIEEMIAIANGNPATAGEYSSYQSYCFNSYAQAARHMGRILEMESLIKASGPGRIEPNIAKDALESKREQQPAIPVTDANRQRIIEGFEGAYMQSIDS